MNKGLIARYIGQAGEYRVMSELLLRGFNPGISAVDNGWDILLENGNKIQVKTARKNDGYKFTFKSGKQKIRDGKVSRPKLDLARIDFLVCWAVDDNFFLIIPSRSMQKYSTISIHSVESIRYHQFINNWDLLREEVYQV
jgi:hypothetical protein